MSAAWASAAASAIRSAIGVTAVVTRPYFSARTNSAAAPSWHQPAHVSSTPSMTGPRIAAPYSVYITIHNN